jgi:hypothetical protein
MLHQIYALRYPRAVIVITIAGDLHEGAEDCVGLPAKMGLYQQQKPERRSITAIAAIVRGMALILRRIIVEFYGSLLLNRRGC